MKTSRLALGAKPCGALHPCASASARPARSGRCLIHLAAIMLLALIGEKAAAASANLAWNPNPEIDITGYKVCYGTSSGSYSTTLSAGAAASASVNGLTEGQTYYFVVKAVNTAGLESAPSTEVVYQVPVPGNAAGSSTILSSSGWKVVSVSSQETVAENAPAIYAFDGNSSTFWHSKWSPSVLPPPHEILIDLGSLQWIQGFRYLPRQDGLLNGTFTQYEFYTSEDGTAWGLPAAAGTLAATSSMKEVKFASRNARYIKFRGLAEATGNGYGNIAELNLLAGDAATITAPAPANQAPVAASQTTSAVEDNSVAITLSASDADGDLLGFTIVSSPTMGSLSGAAPNLTYTPAANANGSDSFTFRVNDGKADSNTATVSITVAAVNDVPVAAAQVVSTSEDKVLGILLSANDRDGDSLSYRIVSGPAKGSLGGIAPNLTYTPAADANGSDSITFVANDGKVDSNMATVSITVLPVNDAPVAMAQATSTLEDKSVGVLLSASDKDGDALSYRIVSSPSKGSLRGTAPNLTYVPNPNVSGSDSFSFSANDGSADSNTAIISITISPVNDAPVAAAQMISASTGTPVGIVLSANDVDGDVLTFSIVSNPTQGSLSGTPPNLSYTPNATASGSDSFSFRASDGKLNSNTATVSINITAAQKTANRAPVFQADLFTRASGVTNVAYVAESLAGSAVDPDADAVSYSMTSGPAWLTVAPDGKISGTPPTGAAGLNSFTIRASDPSGAFDEAALELTIQPGTQLPLPWSLGRIGSLSQDATAWGDLISLCIKSSGTLAGSVDSGVFTWQTLSGDGEITARISMLENANSSSRVGLEIRESLSANAKHVFIGTDGTGALYVISRTKAGASTSLIKVGTGQTPNLWLRLSRSGNSFNVFTSQNGSSWIKAGKVSMMMGISNYIGLMTSGGGSNLSTGIFQDVTVNP